MTYLCHIVIMRLFMIIILAISLAISSSAMGQKLPDPSNDEILAPIGDNDDENIDDDDNEEEEEEEEDINEPEQATLGNYDEGEDQKEIIIEATFTVDYIFAESLGSSSGFIIKYTFKIQGNINANVAVIKGNADIKTEVEGFLSKWPTGDCKLSINLPKIPFTMTFRKVGDEKAKVSLRFKGGIQEQWESKCTFQGGEEFITTGPPEKWLTKALAKTSPPLRSLVAKIDPDSEKTTATFTVRKFNVKDDPIGSAQIEGSGTLTIREKE